MRLLIICFIIYITCHVTQGTWPADTSINTDDDVEVSDAEGLNYLRKFGYAKSPNPLLGNLMTQEELSDAIKHFQRFARLPITGIMDKTTRKKMGSKRCGNPDIGGTENNRKKRYALQGTKWQKKEVTFTLESYATELGYSQTLAGVTDALDKWARASGLTFTHVPSKPADIIIKFASRSHGDGDPFDGKGKTLAHAYFPYPGSEIGGDAHFDADEVWLMTPARHGTSLVIAGAHEFGHSLGLSHSDVTEALMAPFYNPTITDLHKDDIKAIQALYGKPHNKPKPVKPTKKTTTTKSPTRTRPYPPATKTPTTRRTTTTKPSYKTCNGKFDGITQTANGTTFAFAGKLYWKLNDVGADEGYPRRILDDWGVAGPIDAALTFNKVTYLFKGKNVFRYVNAEKLHKHKQSIGNVFMGVPENIDSAFVWSGNGRVYFTRGDKYWRYNPYFKDIDDGYPRGLNVWKGLPADGVDAALQWNEKTYFFKDGKYWKLDDATVSISQNIELPYPRKADEWWLGCMGSSSLENPGGSAAGIQSTFFIQLLAALTSLLLTRFIV